MNVLARSIRSVVWIVADSWISGVMGAVSYLLLMRMLGPEVFGTIAIAGMFFGMVSTFVGGALTESVQQRSELEEGHLNGTFWLNTFLCLVFSGIIAASAQPLGQLFDSPTLANVLPLLALAALISSFGALPRALLERDLQNHKIAALNVAVGLISSCVALALAISGFGIWSLVASILTGTSLGTLAVWAMVSWRPGLYFTRRHIRDLAQFNRDTILTNLLGFLDDAIPRGILAFVAGERAVGLFDLAMKMSSALSGVIISPIAEVAMNTVARMQSSKDDVHALLHRLFMLTTSLIYPMTLGAIVLAPIALPFVFGDAWQDVVLPAQLALLIGLRNASGDLNIAILRGFGNSRAPVTILLIGVALQIALSPLIIWFGVVGAVVAVAIRVFATWPISADHVGRICGYGLWRQISVGLPALAAASIMAAVAWLVALALTDHLTSMVSITLITVTGVVIYGALLLVSQRWQHILIAINWFKNQTQSDEHHPAVTV
ncbi:MAG: oligosaccharide flippase family protein [Pseudomonadota bacterium]